MNGKSPSAPTVSTSYPFQFSANSVFEVWYVAVQYCQNVSYQSLCNLCLRHTILIMRNKWQQPGVEASALENARN